MALALLYGIFRIWTGHRPQSGGSPDPDAEPRAGKLPRYADSAKAVRALITNLLVLAAIGLVLVLAAREVLDVPIAIEPIRVPESLQQEGLTGEVVAELLIERIAFIGRVAETSLERPGFHAGWDRPAVELEVVGAGITPAAIAALLRSFAGIDQPRLTGEVLRRDDDYLLRFRLRGREPLVQAFTMETLETAIQEASDYAYRHTQPFILAAYYAPRFPDRAHAIIDEILASPASREHFYAWNLRGLLQESSQPAAALASFTEAIEFDCPASACAIADEVRAAAWSNRGRTQMRLDNSSAALADLERAFRLDSRNPRILNNLAIATRPQEPEKALSLLDRCLRNDPTFVDAHVNRGALLLSLGRLEEAEQSLRTAVTLDPAEALAYYNRGHLHLAQSDTEKAMSDFRQAVELQPTLQVAIENLVKLERAVSGLGEVQP